MLFASKFAVLGACLASFAASATVARASSCDGFAPFSYPAAKKSLQTWYRVTGDLSAGVPLITLHGGPGGGYWATNPFTSFEHSHHIPVIQYDQIGSGQSTHLQELASAGPEFWNDELFVAELDNLISYLKLETYDVLGYSWGGMLAARFASNRPIGLRKLVLASTSASSALWEESMTSLIEQLPQETQDILNEGNASGNLDSPEYQAALAEYESQFLCRISPLPADLNATIATVIEDPTVYSVMWGASEFKATGTLRDWTVVDVVGNIAAETLVTNGQYDEAQDLAIKPFLQNIPNVKHAKFLEASHTSQYEQREWVLEVVGAFLAK